MLAVPEVIAIRALGANDRGAHVFGWNVVSALDAAAATISIYRWHVVMSSICQQHHQVYLVQQLTSRFRSLCLDKCSHLVDSLPFRFELLEERVGICQWEQVCFVFKANATQFHNTRVSKWVE